MMCAAIILSLSLHFQRYRKKNLFENIREEMNENKWDIEQSKCVNVFLIWDRRVLVAREVPRLAYEKNQSEKRHVSQ